MLDALQIQTVTTIPVTKYFSRLASPDLITPLKSINYFVLWIRPQWIIQSLGDYYRQCLTCSLGWEIDKSSIWSCGSIECLMLFKGYVLVLFLHACIFFQVVFKRYSIYLCSFDKIDGCWVWGCWICVCVVADVTVFMVLLPISVSHWRWWCRMCLKIVKNRGKNNK